MYKKQWQCKRSKQLVLFIRVLHPPRFPPCFPVFPRFPPFFLHLYPLNHVTDFPLFVPLVKNHPLYPAPKQRLAAYCSRILGTLDP